MAHPNTDDASMTTPGSLAAIALFDGLTNEARAEIEMRCAWRSYAKDAEIFNRHSDSRSIYFIAKGAVRIVNFATSGREVAYARVGEGDCFGELSAVDGRTRSASVVALEPTICATLGPDTLIEVLHQHPQVAVELLRKLAGMVRDSDERILDLATLSAFQRVYAELLKLVRKDPVNANSWLVHPLPTQLEIAAQASTTRETVARVLSQLSRDGLVERKSRTLYIRDYEGLQELGGVGGGADADTDSG